MKKKKGFTLVELLAVIVILAVILVIAVPKIMDTIQNAKEGTFMSSAKLIANQAEKKYIENQTLGITDKIECADIVKTSDADYASCDILFDSDGKASVTISGKGKFEGMAVCNATKTEASISNGCYTDEACFAYENGEITDFDIDKDACKAFLIADDTPTEDAEVLCSGGTLSDGYNLRENIEAAIDDGSSEAMEFVNYLIDEGVIINIEAGVIISGYAYEDSACGSDVWVPDIINDMPVIGIGDYAFTAEGVYPEPNPVSNNKKEYSIMPIKNNSYNVEVMPIEQANIGIGITSIKFPNTIEFIGYAAFMDNDEMFSSGVLDFSNLTNLEHIHDNAFKNTGINTIILPDNVRYIGNGAFEWNPLENVTIGNSNAQIGCDAFGDSRNVTLPEGLPDWYYSDSCKYCLNCAV